MSTTNGPGRLAGAFDRDRLLDVALAAAAAVAVAVAIAADIHESSGNRSPDLFAYVLAVGIGAVLLVRRRWPMGTLAATIALLLGYYSLGYPPIGAAVPVAAAFFSAAEQGRLRASLTWASAYLVFTTAFRVIQEDEDLGYLLGLDLVASVTLLAAVIALGDAIRSRRERDSAVLRRAEAAERDREREASRRVEEERLRIARDVHDVLAHTVSIISVQADVAREALADDPSATAAAVEAIRAASRDALGELRTTLELLRGTDTLNRRNPVAGLAHVDRLADAARATGLVVTVDRTGEVRPLPTSVEVVAHRIVQESLTNVVRHAAATAATIELHFDPDRLHVRIADDGTGRAPRQSDGAGVGIQGMHERAALIGGELDAGADDGTGFVVDASLPVGTGP